MSSNRMSKKGLSIMIGYVLLITAAVVMGIIVYQWMKTYVPTEVPSCPDGTSILIKDVTCSEGYKLNVTVKNNGRFSLGGYFIRATNNSNQTIATMDLSNLTFDRYGNDTGGIVKFLGTNPLSPGKEREVFFNLTSQKVVSIEIIPIRYQKKDNKWNMVICGDAKTKDTLATPCGDAT